MPLLCFLDQKKGLDGLKSVNDCDANQNCDIQHANQKIMKPMAQHAFNMTNETNGPVIIVMLIIAS